jgi:hypothetical protein
LGAPEVLRSAETLGVDSSSALPGNSLVTAADERGTDNGPVRPEEKALADVTERLSAVEQRVGRLEERQQGRVNEAYPGDMSVHVSKLETQQVAFVSGLRPERGKDNYNTDVTAPVDSVEVDQEASREAVGRVFDKVRRDVAQRDIGQ